jgi:phosphocarrier protein HPr
MSASPSDDQADAGTSGAVTRVMKICNEKGLHARASAKFVQVVEKYDARVSVSRSSESVGGDSIMGLMMLAAGPGTTITVAASGDDAEAALAAITELVESKFNEEGI